MKTKLFRVGRRSVSVILAVMMLLSTMLVGTVSTVSAASTLQPTTGEVADGCYRIFVTDNYKFGTAPYIHYWGGSSSTNWDSRPTMNKVDGTNEQGQSVYWYDVPSNSTGVIFQHPNQKQSVDLGLGEKTDLNSNLLKFENGAGYYISGEDGGKYKYDYWDASSLLPQVSTPVADSVSLSADPTTVTVGSSVTLTATVDSPAANNITYSFTKASGGNATESQNGNTLTVTPSAAGTYKYTVTAKADGYSDVTSAEVTITASYTDTQNAYLALEEYVNTVKDTSADDYTTDSFATFSSALKSAQTLLTGLPSADATDADKYTSAQTELNAAFSSLEKDVTYYIGGRFMGKSWNANRTDMPFTKVSGKADLYKLETNMTVSALSVQVDNADQYFFIHTGNGRDGDAYYASESNNGHNFQTNTINNQLTLKETAKGTDNVANYIKFYDTSNTSSNVVLYLDTSDKDNFKLYYTADIDPEYRLTGSPSAIGGWNGYNDALKFDTLESDGSYSKEITVTESDLNQSFKLINSSNVYYGPNDGTSDINTHYSYDSAYDTWSNSGSGNDFYFSKTGVYKVHYVVKSGKTVPSIWVEEVSTMYDVIVADGVDVTVSPIKATKNTTVTVTPNSIPDGKVISSVTVLDADNRPVTVKLNGKNATFTMPESNVTVSAVSFKDAERYTVNFSSNNTEYGTVTAEYNGSEFVAGSKVTEGDTVTFTANAKGTYSFTNWTVTVNGTSTTYTGSLLSLPITADTTVVANFDDDPGTIVNNMYFLYGTGQDPSGWQGKQGWQNSDYPKQDVYLKDGKYIVTIDSNSKLFSHNTLYFGFSTQDHFNNMVPNSSELKVSSENPESINLVTADRSSHYAGTDTEKYFGRYAVNTDNKDYLSKLQIIYDPSAKTYTVKAVANDDLPAAGSIEITAKDGTIRSGYATNASLGDTTIEVVTPEGKTLKVTDSYNNLAQTVKRVPDGSTVTVTTTIDETKTFAGVKGSGYYVKGFSVNGIFGGVLSQSEGQAHESNVYSFTFTVNQELYNETKLEITPVYFLKDDTNCVYFYIENYEAASGIWGNTPACYVYYDNEGSNAFGDYPGQPMVDYNGSIFTQIPKYVDGDTTKKITGMTLNNYVWDDVHAAYNGKNQKNDNAQTYDYDDFVKIAESGAQADNIIYRYKYNTTNNIPAATLNASVCDSDGWEVFLDYQNYPTDIFGNKLSNTKLDYKDLTKVTENEEYLSIISDGYQDNYVGKYATAWSIYDKAGNRVATIPSSALLYALGKTDAKMTEAINSSSTPTDFLPGKKDRDSHWSTFKSLYNTYKGVYAQINFEGSIKNTSGDIGNRLDGRWYYSQNQQEITGEIKIQYGNTLDDFKVGDYKEDTFADGEVTSVKGTVTGAEAYFTDPENRVRKLTTTADNTQDYKFEVQATSTEAYTFVGWYRLIDGDYKAVNPSDISSLTGAVTRNADVTLVARYIKTPGGSMTFNHSLYTGENAGGGTAATEIQVVVTDSEGKIHYDSGRIAGTASIDKNTITNLATLSNVTVTVTLYTTTKNLDNFNGYYNAENTTTLSEFAPADLTTTVNGDRINGLETKSVYSFSFNDYYSKYSSTLVGENPGTVYHNFYSDISYIKVPYKVQFSYTDREGKTKYYNKAGYVDPENTSSYTLVDKDSNANGVESHAVEVTLTNSFILSLAPYESNFTKNLTWNETPESNTAFDSSESKSVASAVVKSTQEDKTIHLNVFTNGKNPVPLEDGSGRFELVEKNGSTELPYNSVFYTANEDGTYKYDIVAPQTYKSSGEELKFMYWAIYSDADCKNLVIKAYNIGGGFSYVSYDNYWIAPVYGENSSTSASVKEVYASTQFMEATRNQWTADSAEGFNGFDADSMATLDSKEDFVKGNGEDKLYADFVLNFFYNGKQLNEFDPDSNKVQTGIVMQKLDLDTGDAGWGYNTDMEYYANKYADELKAAADDAIKTAKGEASNIPSLSKQINNSRLNNKNRLQYYARFNNTESNTNCVYRVYTYVKYVNESGNTVVELGDPIYFTFYDVANATA